MAKLAVAGPVLPYEILVDIARIALAPQWHACYFFPPTAVPTVLNGFSMASHAFSEIFQSVQHEILYVQDMDHLASMDIPFRESIRYLHIGNMTLKAPTSSQLPVLLQLAPRLYALSIPDMECIGLGLAHVSKECQIRSLKKLEVRKGAPRAPTVISSIVTNFRDITALRLGNDALNTYVDNPFLFHYNLIGFEITLSKRLSALKRLRELSLDICLESFDHLGAIRVHHYSNIEHTQPSEGYERHYSDCPFCLTSYRPILAVQRENEVTMILAQALDSLESVSWVYGWCRSWRDGQGRREVLIQRTGDKIRLQREKTSLL